MFIRNVYMRKHALRYFEKKKPIPQIISLISLIFFYVFSFLSHEGIASAHNKHICNAIICVVKKKQCTNLACQSSIKKKGEKNTHLQFYLFCVSNYYWPQIDVLFAMCKCNKVFPVVRVNVENFIVSLMCHFDIYFFNKKSLEYREEQHFQR